MREVIYRQARFEFQMIVEYRDGKDSLSQFVLLQITGMCPAMHVLHEYFPFLGAYVVQCFVVVFLSIVLMTTYLHSAIAFLHGYCCQGLLVQSVLL